VTNEIKTGLYATKRWSARSCSRTILPHQTRLRSRTPYNILLTADAVSPVPGKVLLSTLIGFVSVYALFMTAFLVFTLRFIRRGPDAAPAQAEASGSLKPALKPRVMEARSRLRPAPAE
jgi:hypothetical protein